MATFIDEETDKAIFKGLRSMRQKRFIMYYCHPESESYDNGCQSYMRAYGSKNTNVSAVESHGLLHKKLIKEAIERYKLYLHDCIAFDLDWLDIELRSLHTRAKVSGQGQLELRTLKAIGDRIGAYTDTKEGTKGITVQMTQEEEKLCNKLMEQLITAKKEKALNSSNNQQLD
jgi:hypothetical protein